LRIRRVTLDKLQCDKLEVSAMTITRITMTLMMMMMTMMMMTTWPLARTTAWQCLEHAQHGHRLPFCERAADAAWDYV